MKFVPQFFSKVRRERREQLKKRAHRRRRPGFPRHCLVDEDHERGYGGVETEMVQVFGDFPDAGVQGFALDWRRLHILNRRAPLDQLKQSGCCWYVGYWSRFG